VGKAAFLQAVTKVSRGGQAVEELWSFKPCGMWHCHWVTSAYLLKGHSAFLLTLKTIAAQSFIMSETVHPPPTSHTSVTLLWEPQILQQLWLHKACVLKLLTNDTTSATVCMMCLYPRMDEFFIAACTPQGVLYLWCLRCGFSVTNTQSIIYLIELLSDAPLYIALCHERNQGCLGWRI
jgi:hypothetical protein